MSLKSRIEKLEQNSGRSPLSLFLRYMQAENEKEAKTFYERYLRADPKREIEEFSKILDRRVATAKRKSQENEKLIAVSDWRIAEDSKSGEDEKDKNNPRAFH